MPHPLSKEVSDRLVSEVIALACLTVRAGGIPFSAIVAEPSGQVIGSGINTVLKDHDPTAHAEVCAIRDACARHGSTSLKGKVLICSGEPCAMCYMVALFAGISEVIFAVSADEAAAHGYHYGQSYRFLSDFPDSWPMHFRHLPLKGGLAPFQSSRQSQS